MDVILPYVAWITLLAYVMDFVLGRLFARGVSLGPCEERALMSALSFRDVWVEYGSQIVLERINLEIAAGTFLSVVGPSGAGKTTFLRLILGQERPTRGTLLIDGEPLPPKPGPDRGVVFQRYSVFPHLTVLGNVLLGYEFAQQPASCAPVRRGARAKAIAESEGLIEEVGLDRASRQISERAVRRHAAAAGDRAGDGAPAARAAARRAVRRARSRHAGADA